MTATLAAQPALDSTPDAAGELELLQILLSWDYLHLCKQLEGGKGILAQQLPPMPSHFSDVQVRRDRQHLDPGRGRVMSVH